MDKGTKILICELFFGEGLPVSSISILVGYSTTTVSYYLTDILVYRNPVLFVNEIVTKQSIINDIDSCGDKLNGR